MKTNVIRVNLFGGSAEQRFAYLHGKLLASGSLMPNEAIDFAALRAILGKKYILMPRRRFRGENP